MFFPTQVIRSFWLFYKSCQKLSLLIINITFFHWYHQHYIFSYGKLHMFSNLRSASVKYLISLSWIICSLLYLTNLMLVVQQSAQRIICSISTAYLQWNFFIAIQPTRQMVSQEDGNPLNFFEERPWHEGMCSRCKTASLHKCKEKDMYYKPPLPHTTILALQAWGKLVLFLQTTVTEL